MKLSNFNTKEYYLELKERVKLLAQEIRETKQAQKDSQRINNQLSYIIETKLSLPKLRSEYKYILQLRAIMKEYRKLTK